MATTCPPDCGDISWEDWIKKSEVERQFFLLCAIQSGSIVPPLFGTSTLTRAVASNSTVTVPAGWTSVAISAPPSNTTAGTVDGVTFPIGHTEGYGVQDGYPGETFTVVSPNTASPLYVGYTISV